MASRKKLIGIAIGAVLLLCILTAAVYYVRKGNESDNSLVLEESTDSSVQVYSSTFSSINNVYSVAKSSSVSKQISNLTKKNDYTVEAPLLVRNAYGTNECSYYIVFTTDEAVYLEYTVHSEDSDISDFTRTASITSGESVTTSHEYQLIGFVPGVENQLTLRLYLEDGSLYQEQTFSGLTVTTTNNVESAVEMEDGTSDAELSDGLFAVFTSNTQQNDEGYDILCYDNDGILRSVYPVSSYRAVRIEQVGDNILYASSARKLVLVSPLGQVLNTYSLGDYSYHHDYQYDEETNTVYLLATDRTDENNYVEDIVISVDLESGDVTEIIDFKDLFPDLYVDATPANDEDESDTTSIDWIHINSLSFVGSANEMVFSSRELSAIINITNINTTPEIKYIIADEFILEGYDAAQYLMDKDESNGEFAYQYGQHDVMYVEDAGLEDGSYYLTMYNNNAGWSHSRESLDWSGLEGVGKGILASKAKGISSYFYKYLVNETTGTFTLVDSFEVVYSGIVSNADYVGDNVVTSSGTSNVFAEYDADGNLIRQFTCGRVNFNYRVFKYDFL